MEKTYTVTIQCGNCLFTEQKSLPRGYSVNAQECENCGCKSYLMPIFVSGDRAPKEKETPPNEEQS